MNTPNIPPQKSEEILNLERIIEHNMVEWNSTPFLVKKEFYAKRIHELAQTYKEVTGRYFVRGA